MNKIYMSFFVVCYVCSVFSYRLRLRFSLLLIKMTARIDRLQTQRNWQRPTDLSLTIVFSTGSGLLHWLLAAKCAHVTVYLGLNFRTRWHSTLRKKEEKTKFWGRLVESVVFQKTVIESTFNFSIESRLNMNIGLFILRMDYSINKRNHFSINEFIRSLATGMLHLLWL